MISFKDKIKNILSNEKSVSLRFLSLDEQSHILKNSHVRLDGGYKEAERKRAYFFDNTEDNIICFRIDYNKDFLTLSHRNILGTLMSLGVTMDSIGDILPKQELFFTTKEIAKELLESFTMIGHVPIRLVEYNGSISSEKELEEHTITLESLRLDLFVSKIAKISRKQAQELILKELVKVNHKVNTKSTTTLREDDVVSIRKHGRFVLLDAKKRSRKGKIVLNFAKYI